MIRGTLDEFSLPEIIRLIASGGRSGTLEIRGTEGSGRVFFKDGLISGAESELPREPIGRKLVRARAVSEEQLWSVLERPSPASKRLGRALIEAGLVNDKQVLAALSEQTEEDVVNVIRLDPLEFMWAPGDPGDLGARLRAEALIKGISDRLQEIQSVRERVPLGGVVSLAAVPPNTDDDIAVSAADWRLLSLLGTHRAVRDLVRYSGAGEVQTLKAISRLISNGLVEVTQAASEAGEGGSATPGAGVWAPEPAAREMPPPPPEPAPRVIRLPDDEPVARRSRVAPFEIAIIGAASRVFNPLTETCLREGLLSMPVQVSSYGLLELPVAPPDPEVVAIAGELGLEISDHRTRRLTEGRLRGVDLVLGFDRFDLENAVSIGGAARERAFTLEEFAAWAERIQAPDNSEFPVRARIVVARAHRGRAETIDEATEPGDAHSRHGSSDRSIATHIRTLCRSVAGVLRPRPGSNSTPPPPPPRSGSYQIG